LNNNIIIIINININIIYYFVEFIRL